MTSSQLTEWIAYAGLEPFGTVVEDQRMGMVCASIMNSIIMAHHDPKKGTPKWYKPEDFIVDYLAEEQQQEKKPKQTIEDMKRVMQEIAGVKIR